MRAFATIWQFLSGAPPAGGVSASSKPPFLLKQRSSSFTIILTVCLAIFTDIFFYALIVPVVPFSLTVQVGLGEDQVQQWTAILLACYSGALFVASPLAGLYADHTSSRRWPLLLGLIALAASTLLLCFSHSIGLLVLGRLLQGVAAAIVWSVGCALLVDTLDTAVGVAMGYVGIAMSIGLIVAPVVGGAVYNAAGYYAVYYIAFGIVALDILMRLFMIEKKVARQWITDEKPATGTESNGDIEKQSKVVGNASAEPPMTQVGGANTGAETTESRAGQEGSLRNETETGGVGPTSQSQPAEGVPQYKHSKLRSILVLVKSPRLLAALYGLFSQAETFGWNSTAAGLMFLAIFLPGFIAPGVGWLADRYGAKWPSFGGFVACVPLLICLRFVTENTIAHKVMLCVLLAVLGSALVFSNTPLMAEITYVIDEKEAEFPGIFGEKGVYGIGYGLFTMAFALGGTIGPLFAGYVNGGPGWGTMTWAVAVWAASGAVVVFFWLGRKPIKPGTDSTSTTETAQEGSRALA
ncbi:major facilitator superfamily domain-containing protein [Apiospora kogelbergensis]|uniref:Major facilitator superfamily domain-containing protein n=1 Tax=Apiospora kogelbergensis TaxID=1337665 RepID=A0AAW0Q7G8_9PEZI